MSESWSSVRSFEPFVRKSLSKTRSVVLKTEQHYACIKLLQSPAVLSIGIHLKYFVTRLGMDFAKAIPVLGFRDLAEAIDRRYIHRLVEIVEKRCPVLPSNNLKKF
jgi:hypothetical protein